jgi:signal-transduction protein with cAMP-binding, CBS, and nucleotidyltransferase domain
MHIADLMHTPPVVCETRRTIREVAGLMETRDVGCVMVVDDAGALAGIVTDRDLALRGVGAGRSADVTVDEVMTRDVATVSPHAPLETAAATMRRRGVRRLPVTEDDGRIHGMITTDDLLQHLGTTADALTDTLLSQRAQAGCSHHHHATAEEDAQG